MEGTRFGNAKRICALWASPVAQLVKNSPAMQETWVQSLGWKDPLEKGKATQYSGTPVFQYSELENSMDWLWRVRHDVNMVYHID